MLQKCKTLDKFYLYRANKLADDKKHKEIGEDDLIKALKEAGLENYVKVFKEALEESKNDVHAYYGRGGKEIKQEVQEGKQREKDQAQEGQ